MMELQLIKGKAEGARAKYEEALRVCSESGSELESGSIYSNLGCLCFQEGDTEEARRCYMKSYKAASEMNLGIQSFDSFIDLRGKLLSAGYSHEDLPWPDHWEPYRESAPSAEENS